jgi:hypothetical protein
MANASGNSDDGEIDTNTPIVAVNKQQNVFVRLLLRMKRIFVQQPAPKGGTENGRSMSAQDDAMHDCWFSTTATDTKPGIFPVGKTPFYTTGIAEAWRKLYSTKQVGPPITGEYDTGDWSGNKIVAQEFPGARCEWKDGKAGWQYR